MKIFVTEGEKMRIPGFTADSSIYRTKTYWCASLQSLIENAGIDVSQAATKRAWCYICTPSGCFYRYRCKIKTADYIEEPYVDEREPSLLSGDELYGNAWI